MAPRGVWCRTAAVHRIVFRSQYDRFARATLGAAAGVTFGALLGAGVTFAAMTITGCAQFLLARHFGGERLRGGVAEKLGRFGRRLERRGVFAVAGARLLPIPFSEFNVLAGLTPIRFRDFALGIAVGGAPKAVVWAGLAALLV